MARIRKDIFDAPDGRVGNVVFSSRNGVPYVRSRPAQYRDAKSAKQLAARARLTLITQLLRDLKPVIRLGFRDLPAGKSARDVAYRANAQTAVKGEYPELYVDYPSVTVSQGPLAAASEANATREGTTLTCSWPADGAPASAPQHPDDRALLTVYDPTTATVITEPFIARRSDGKVELALSAPLASAETLHVWLSFVSHDGLQVSNSVYAG